MVRTGFFYNNKQILKAEMGFINLVWKKRPLDGGVGQDRAKTWFNTCKENKTPDRQETKEEVVKYDKQSCEQKRLSSSCRKKTVVSHDLQLLLFRDKSIPICQETTEYLPEYRTSVDAEPASLQTTAV